MRLDPSRRDGRQLEGEGGVDERDEHVVRRIHARQLREHLVRIVEEKVRDDRHHRDFAEEARDRAAQRERGSKLLQALAELVGVETVNDLPLADAGSQAAQILEPGVEGEQPDGVLEENRRHPQRRDRPGHRCGYRLSVDPAPGRRRCVRENDDAGRARLFEVADDERAEAGECGLRPVDRLEAVARLPVAQPDEIEPRAVEEARVLADRELAHPFHDAELDLRHVRQGDEGHLAHGIGVRSMMSAITASVVRPWLAACGPSQMRWPSTYGARSWMSSG